MAADKKMKKDAVDETCTDTEALKCVCGADPVENASEGGFSIACSECSHTTDTYADRAAAVSFWNMRIWKPIHLNGLGG